MSDYRGKFIWYELLTTDVEAAKVYYSETIGWSTEAWEGGGSPYTMWIAEGGPIGGVMELPEEAKKMGAPPHWLAYVGTPDLDETVAKAKELGAEILVTMDIPKVGRIGVMKDPQGAVIAAFTPEGDPPGHNGDSAHGAIAWRELATTDIDQAWSFYEAVFGWKKTKAMDMGEMGTYQMFGHGDESTGGIFVKPPNIPAPPHWLLYAKVPDVNQNAEAVKSRGGQVLNGPMEVPEGGLIAQCMDPQGAAFAIYSSTADE